MNLYCQSDGSVTTCVHLRSILKENSDFPYIEFDAAICEIETVRGPKASIDVLLENTSLRIDDPDLRNAHLCVVDQLLVEFLDGIVRAENLKDRERRDGHDLLFGVNTIEHRNIRNAIPAGFHAHAQLRNGPEIPFLCMFSKPSLNRLLPVAVIVRSHSPLSDLAVHVLGIRIEDRTEVLLFRDVCCRAHR